VGLYHAFAPGWRAVRSNAAEVWDRLERENAERSRNWYAQSADEDGPAAGTRVLALSIGADGAREEAIGVIRRRIDLIGLEDVAFERDGSRLVLRVPRLDAVRFGRIRSLLTRAGGIVFRPVLAAGEGAPAAADPPPYTDAYDRCPCRHCRVRVELPADGAGIRLSGETVLSEADLASPYYGPSTINPDRVAAGVPPDEADVRYVLECGIRRSAASAFGDYTETHRGGFLAVVLDGEWIRTLPVTGRIDRSVGLLNLNEALGRELSVTIRSGRLPCTVSILEVQTRGGDGKSKIPNPESK
jgi:preprotein translocase subunit SecD